MPTETKTPAVGPTGVLGGDRPTPFIQSGDLMNVGNSTDTTPPCQSHASPQVNAVGTSSDPADQAPNITDEPRPSWMVRPCMPDCTARHGEHDHPEDRSCWSAWSGRLRMSLHGSHFENVGGRVLQLEPDVTIYYRREFREFEPRVVIEPDSGRPDIKTLELTVDEAEQLAQHLAAAVKHARGDA